MIFYDFHDFQYSDIELQMFVSYFCDSLMEFNDFHNLPDLKIEFKGFHDLINSHFKLHDFDNCRFSEMRIL